MVFLHLLSAIIMESSIVFVPRSTSLEILLLLQIKLKALGLIQFLFLVPRELTHHSFLMMTILAGTLGLGLFQKDLPMKVTGKFGFKELILIKGNFMGRQRESGGVL